MPTAAKDEEPRYRLQIGGMTYLRLADGSAQLIHNGVVCNIEKTGTRLRDALKIRLGDQARQEWNGVPPDDDKDGWHWLQLVNTDEAIPYRWDATDEYWEIDGPGFEGWAPDEVAKRFAYRGPCAHPDAERS